MGSRITFTGMPRGSASTACSKYSSRCLPDTLLPRALAGSEAVTYWVCSVCGYTTTKVDFTKCPSCFESKDNYVAVA